MPGLIFDDSTEAPMNFPYVVLPEDGLTHLAGEYEETVCGVAIPMHAGAQLLEDAGDGKKCPDCFPDEKKAKAKSAGKA